MSDEDNVIELFPDHNEAKHNLIKTMLTEAFEYVHANPQVQEAVVMFSSPTETYTFRTPVSDPFMFIGMLELMKHKTLKTGFE
jgi:hypothetical protein